MSNNEPEIMFSTVDKAFMAKALRLAEKGAGAVAPNPRVGAVIVKNDIEIGSGWHHRFGGDHAEIEAIKDCHKKGYDPSTATLYVTLEPCCHHGKTPPCTDAIINAKLKKVVVATLDPTEKVAGKGIKTLQAAGVTVEVGCCEPQAQKLIAGFVKLNRRGCPLVILKWAQSLDGKISWPKETARRWVTAEPARRDVHKLRSQCGAVLVGIETLITDNCELTVRLGRGKHYQPTRVVLDTHLRTPLNSRLLETRAKGPIIIYCSKNTLAREVAKRQALIEQGIEVIAGDEKDGLLQLGDVLDDLGRRGVTELLVEGGAKIHRSFMDQRLADRVIVYVGPMFIGDGPDVRSMLGIETLRDIEIDEVKLFEQDMRITGSWKQI